MEDEDMLFEDDLVPQDEDFRFYNYNAEGQVSNKYSNEDELLSDFLGTEVFLNNNDNPLFNIEDEWDAFARNHPEQEVIHYGGISNVNPYRHPSAQLSSSPLDLAVKIPGYIAMWKSLKPVVGSMLASKTVKNAIKEERKSPKHPEQRVKPPTPGAFTWMKERSEGKTDRLLYPLWLADKIGEDISRWEQAGIEDEVPGVYEKHRDPFLIGNLLKTIEQDKEVY